METFPHSIQRTLKFLQAVGLLNQSHYQSKWKARLWELYFQFTHIIFSIAIADHWVSTWVRSIGYLPEFFQRITEDFFFTLYYLQSMVIFTQYNSIQSLIKHMERNFSFANAQVVRRANRKANMIFYVFFFAMILAFTMAFLEPRFPLSAEETEMIRHTYNRKQPERRMPTNFWLPFVDDSDSYYFEFLFAMQIYLVILLLVAGCTVSFMPMFIVYIESQYEILGEFIEKVGHIHTDGHNNLILYTCLRRGEFLYVSHLIPDMSTPELRTLYREYDAVYCRQIIRFHQMLVVFQRKVSKT